MSRLIVYCRAVPYKRHEFNENCCEMHSFSENAFNDLLERSPEGLHLMLLQFSYAYIVLTFLMLCCGGQTWITDCT